MVRKALSAVARTHDKFGLQAALNLLAGLPDPRLARSGLDATKTFGILKDKSPEWILSLLRRCVTAGWVDFTTGDRPMVLLTPAGKVVLFGDGPVRVLLPPDETARPKTRAGGAGQNGKPPPTRPSILPMRRCSRPSEPGGWSWPEPVGCRPMSSPAIEPFGSSPN